MQSKGQTEQDLIDTGFKQVSIFRPGFLQVEEERPNPRLGESMLGKFANFSRSLGFKFDIPVGAVGRSMIYAAAQPAANSENPGKTVSRFIYNDEIEKTGTTTA
jgi:hypothetical protein